MSKIAIGLQMQETQKRPFVNRRVVGEGPSTTYVDLSARAPVVRALGAPGKSRTCARLTVGAMPWDRRRHVHLTRKVYNLSWSCPERLGCPGSHAVTLGKPVAVFHGPKACELALAPHFEKLT